MSFLIADAYAAAPGTTSGNDFSSFILLIGFVVIFYFFLLRPQNKRAKEQRNMIENLAKGDEVITSGGLLGKISKLSDDFVILNLNDTLEVKLQKSYVAAVVPKGTMKSV